MIPDTNPDPVKALLEACEPLSALVADYEAAGIDTDDVILCGRTPWNAQPDEPEPPRILFRDLRALARAASVLREREDGESKSYLADLVKRLRDVWSSIRTGRFVGDGDAAVIDEAIELIQRTSGSAGREMPTRNQIAWALYDREHERSMHADRVVAKMRGREFKDTMEPFEECADVFLGDADAVLALFPAPGKETT